MNKANHFVDKRKLFVLLFSVGFSGFVFFFWESIFPPDPSKVVTPSSSPTVVYPSTTLPPSPPNNASSSGDQNQLIAITGENQGGRTIKPSYGVPQSIVDTLQAVLEEKKVHRANREAQIQVLAAKYKELDHRLSERTDDLSTQAREALQNGDLEEVEGLLKQSIAKQRETLADDYFNLAKAQELQLKYGEALESFQQAVVLEPENSTYLSDYGIHLQTLGKIHEAIDFYEKALAIDLKEKGQEHLLVERHWNKLGAVWYALGDHEQAVEYYQKALASNLKNHGEGHEGK